MLARWLPVGPWSGPLAAALVTGAVAPPLAWHVLRLRAALLKARSDAVDSSFREDSTGMVRRLVFLDLAEREWARAGRYGGAVALLLVEIDRLRSMTEHSGDGVADALMAALAQDILKSLRGADMLARFDGAQIAVFLPQADPTGALDVADRIREGVEKLSVPGLPAATRVTASIGVAVMRPAHHPLSTLLTDTGHAVQAARQAGGNCVRLAPIDRRRPLQRGPLPGGHKAAREGD